MKIWMTRMSTKGQVVIPENIRKEVKAKPGDLFRVEITEDSDTQEKCIMLIRVDVHIDEVKKNG